MPPVHPVHEKSTRAGNHLRCADRVAETGPLPPVLPAFHAELSAAAPVGSELIEQLPGACHGGTCSCASRAASLDGSMNRHLPQLRMFGIKLLESTLRAGGRGG